MSFSQLYLTDQDAIKMMDRDVVNNQGDEVGTIENFLISDTANVEYAILSVGRFLGIGEKLVCVPKQHLQLNKHKGNVLLNNVTKEQLESAPEFDYSLG